jgi:hypothetical protein
MSFVKGVREGGYLSKGDRASLGLEGHHVVNAKDLSQKGLP